MSRAARRRELGLDSFVKVTGGHDIRRLQPWGAPARYNEAHAMDALRQEFFDAIALRQGYRRSTGKPEAMLGQKSSSGKGQETGCGVCERCAQTRRLDGE